MLQEIYSPTAPVERVLSEEEKQRVSNMRARYFRPSELADGLPIAIRRPTRPRQMNYNGTQTTDSLPRLGASSHSKRLLK